MKMKEALKDISKDIHISYLGPIIGSAIGPDSFTINFYEKKVTLASED